MNNHLAEGLSQLDELRRARDAGEGPGPCSLQLAGAALLGADLQGLDLSGSDFTGADLSGANLDASVECNKHTVWSDGTNSHGSECPPTN